MERMIRVTGKGKLAVRPDTISLHLDLQGIRPEYKDALGLSTEWTEGLKDAIERENFDRKALKTLHFGINAEYTSYRDPLDDSWKQRFE